MAHGLEDGIVKLGRAWHEEGGVLWLARHDCDRIFVVVSCMRCTKRTRAEVGLKCCDMRKTRLVKEGWE
jgi:hypothetical protein